MTRQRRQSQTPKLAFLETILNQAIRNDELTRARSIFSLLVSAVLAAIGHGAAVFDWATEIADVAHVRGCVFEAERKLGWDLSEEDADEIRVAAYSESTQERFSICSVCRRKKDEIWQRTYGTTYTRNDRISSFHYLSSAFSGLAIASEPSELELSRECFDFACSLTSCDWRGT